MVKKALMFADIDVVASSPVLRNGVLRNHLYNSMMLSGTFWYPSSWPLTHLHQVDVHVVLFYGAKGPLYVVFQRNQDTPHTVCPNCVLLTLSPYQRHSYLTHTQLIF